MPEDTLRDTLEKAYDKAETNAESGGPPESTPEPVRTATAEESNAGPSAKTEVSVDSNAGDQPSTKADGVDQNADPTKPAVQTQEDEEIKNAPTSWKAAEREHWASASPELRRAIARREKDVQKLIERGSNEGRFRAQFESVTAPFKKYIDAQGGNPFQSIHRLMSTAATLQDGSTHQKAALVADLISSFKVDIEMLDQMLAKGVPMQKPQPMTREDVHTAVRESMQSMMPNPRTEQARRVQTDVDGFFKDPKNEYANDVALDMADLMEMAGRRGEEMTLKEAYERACKLNPDVQGLIRKKEADALNKKKQAGSSLPSNTTHTKNVPKVTASSSMREDIEAAIAHLSSR